MIKRHQTELEEIQFPSLSNQGSATLRIASKRLETGMFVVALEGAWTGTNLPRGGLLLSDPHQVANLRNTSENALIDLERSDTGRHTAIRIAAQLFGSELEAPLQRGGLAPAPFSKAQPRFGPGRIPPIQATPATPGYQTMYGRRHDDTGRAPQATRMPLADTRIDAPDAWPGEGEAARDDSRTPALPVIPDFAPIDSGSRSGPPRDVRIAKPWRVRLHDLMAENGRVVVRTGEDRGLLAKARALFTAPRLPIAEPGKAIAALKAGYGEPVGQSRHVADCAIDDTVRSARTTYARLLTAHAQALTAARQDTLLPWETIEQALHGLADSVIEHPDSVLWCDRMHEQRSLGNRPPATAAVLMARFARHLDMPRDAIIAFGAIGMTMDLGKVNLPRELVNLASPYDREQFERMKIHVEASLSLLRRTPGVPPEVIRAVAEHHERRDGSGYPRRLAGAAIGLHGACAGIVDTYTALISARSYANPLSPEDALAALIGWSEKEFDPALVEQFALSVGMFPVGSAVELADGGLGMVIEVEQDRGFGPRVLVLTGADGKPAGQRGERPAGRARRTPGPAPAADIRRGTAVKIARGLPVGAFGVRLPDFHARMAHDPGH
jgi:HD-GYP domain-containing protein (c-di-GMP phosphodiesterase class II)